MTQEWELVKENYQPRKKGRAPGDLALGSVNPVSINEETEKKQQ